MENRCKSIFDAKVIFGLAIIIAGLVLFLENVGIIGYVNIWDWWPVLLILLGIGQLAQPKECRQTWTGIVLVGVGLLFLGNNLDIFYFRFRDLWPLILILVGLSILRHTTWKSKDLPQSNDFINLSYILGGGDRAYTTQNLEGGKISAIMGGGSIDLRDASFPGEVIYLEVFAFWGGFDITVPRNWNVNIQVTPIMGGVENKVRQTVDAQSTKTIIIRGTVVMGGVEVKN
jgi:predicted membrane protein